MSKRAGVVIDHLLNHNSYETVVGDCVMSIVRMVETKSSFL